MKRGRDVGELVAAEALTWIGTPFVWGQSVKERGCDCKGLIAGVARELEAGRKRRAFTPPSPLTAPIGPCLLSYC
jgi:cell wall-associated NlpC family hydrolase